MLTAVATFANPIQLAKYGQHLWRSRQLMRAFTEAQNVLGERMYAAGIDDGVLGAKITALDQWIRQVEAAGASSQELKASRKKLILQLAAAAQEEDGPLPGADPEYRKAGEAQIALAKHEKGLNAVRGGSGSGVQHALQAVRR